MLWFSDERDGAEVLALPVAAPVEWRIIQSPQSDRHLMAVLSNGAVRSTSAIASALSEPLAVITSSGRMCRLTQAPAKDPDVRLKLLGSAIRIGLAEFSDVSEQFWIELGNAPGGRCSDAPVGSGEVQQEKRNMPQAPGAPT